MTRGRKLGSWMRQYHRWNENEDIHYLGPNDADHIGRCKRCDTNMCICIWKYPLNLEDWKCRILSYAYIIYIQYMSCKYHAFGMQSLWRCPLLRYYIAPKSEALLPLRCHTANRYLLCGVVIFIVNDNKCKPCQYYIWETIGVGFWSKKSHVLKSSCWNLRGGENPIARSIPM